MSRPSIPNGHEVVRTSRLRVRAHDGLIIAELDGVVDMALASETAPVLRRIGRGLEAMIVSLDDTTLVGRNGLFSLLEVLLSEEVGAPLALVCRRRSGRRQLKRWAVSDHIPVYGTVRDALQARLFAATGYAEPWAARPQPWWTPGPTAAAG